MHSRSVRSLFAVASVAALALIAPGASSAAVTASLDNDTPYAPDKPVTFTVDVFGATGAIDVKWVVDCPETTPYDFTNAASTGTANTLNHTFTTTGQHSLCVRVADTNSVDTDRINFQVWDEVDPGPTAALVVTPAEPRPGGLVTLDASASVNAVPGNLKYEFDADGDFSNGYEVDNGSNPILQRTYDTFSGNVGVQVTDRNLKSSSKTVPLKVAAAVVTPPPGTNTPTPPGPVGTGDGPLGTVTFSALPCTINQFLSSGLEVKALWGDVYGKLSVTYFLQQSKKVKKKGKTKTVTTRLKIVSAADNVFYGSGSGFSRQAKGASAKALRKLKSAKVIVAWTVTSKKGDKKSGELVVSMKKGL